MAEEFQTIVEEGAAQRTYHQRCVPGLPYQTFYIRIGRYCDRLFLYGRFIRRHYLRKKKTSYNLCQRMSVCRSHLGSPPPTHIYVANDEASHVPTASQVNRVFGAVDDDDDERLEEIDFSEVGRVQAEVDVAAANSARIKEEMLVIEEKFTGFYVDTEPAPPMSTAPTQDADEVLGDEEEQDVIVYVAPHPRAGPVTPSIEDQPLDVLPTTSILTGLALTGDELRTPESQMDAPQYIADDAPAVEIAVQMDHPRELQSEDTGALFKASAKDNHVEFLPTTEKVTRTGHTVGALDEVPNVATEEAVIEAITADDSTQTESPVPTAQSVAVGDVTFSFKQAATQKIMRRMHPVRTPRSLVKSRTKARRKPLGRFRSFGASMAEAQLHAEDPRIDERRLGDSDLDWGGDSDGDPVEQISNGIGDMDIDGDIDLKAMENFVKGMSAEGSRTVTMDDIADAQRMKEEDEDETVASSPSADESSSGEEDGIESEMVIQHEEEILIAEDGEAKKLGELNEESEDDSSTDESVDTSPHEDFQAKLQRMRKKTEGKGKTRQASPRDSDEDEDVEMELDRTWADSTEDYIEQVCHFSFAPVCGLTGHRKSWTEKEISLERIVLVVRNFSNPSTMAISITMNTSG